MLKKTNIINIKSFLLLSLIIITLISLSHFLSFTSSPPSFAQSTAGKTSLENNQIKDKPSAKTPSPDSDITSNISLILTPSPDIINPTDNQDFQVPEENLKTGAGNDKTAGAGGAAAENSYLKDNSLITPGNQNKTNSGSGTSETTIKPSVITPANSKKTASAGEPATANSYSKGKSLITASNQNKTNSGSGTSETTIKPSVITPANATNTSAITNGTGKQDAIGNNNNNNTAASPNIYPNGNPIGTNATDTAAAATTTNITSNITAASNQNKTNSGSGTSETTIKPSVITPANSTNTSAITNGTGKQDAIGNNNNNNNTTASPNIYPNGNPIGTNATDTAAAATTTNITAASNQNKTNSGSGTSETTIKPSVITPANSTNTSAITNGTGKQDAIGNNNNKTISDASLTGNNKSSPQEANTKNPVKVSNLTSNKTSEQGSSAFPWLDQISKILGVK